MLQLGPHKSRSTQIARDQSNWEVQRVRSIVFEIRPLAFNQPVERRVSLLIDFAALRFISIELGAISNLRGAKILGMLADSKADVVPFQAERFAPIIHPPDRDVHMRVTGIVMADRRPFECRPEIPFHLGQKGASMGL
jgi:hypothetical protein